jgi:dipeptide/tripeptide permease
LIVLFQPLALGPLQKWSRAHVLAVGALLYGIGFGLTGLSRGVAFYALSIAVWTAGEIFSTAVAPAVVADAAPASLRGSYQGTFYLSWSAASFMAPALGSLVMGRLGAGTLWAGCAAIGTIAALLHLPVVPRIRRVADDEPVQNVA